MGANTKELLSHCAINRNTCHVRTSFFLILLSPDGIHNRRMAIAVPMVDYVRDMEERRPHGGVAGRS